MKSILSCVTCERALSGRQRRFCSRHCKNADTNNRHQSYAAQKSRGLRRKIELLDRHGARCRSCGYDRNLAALSWHHVDPRKKAFSLDMRSLSNRSETEILREAAKCVVLCLNCHAETHFPEFVVSALIRQKSAERSRSR